MIDIELYNKINNYLRDNLKETRYLHSISVAFTAMNLAAYYNINKDDAFIAGMLHDMAKNYTDDEMINKCKEYNISLTDEDYLSIGVLHCYVGAYEARKIFNVNDDIYNAIYTHTLGDINMTMLQKIIFVSDFIEPMRDFEEDISDIVKLAYKDIDKCILYMYREIIGYLKKKNKYLNKKTIEVYEYLLKKYEK